MTISQLSAQCKSHVYTANKPRHNWAAAHSIATKRYLLTKNCSCY